MVTLTTNKFNPIGCWQKPIARILFKPTPEDIYLFDQNGYDLTLIEQRYAYENQTNLVKQRDYKYAIKFDWFKQDSTIEGAVLNHSNLFERKAYNGLALIQLQRWAEELPLLHKIIAMRPKWGLDFSMDYVDRAGNAFEILHWEWDAFDYIEIEAVRKIVEPVLQAIDWEDAGKQLLNKKSQWHHLDFFAQSDWKCNYFGIPKERFKMVIWK